MALLFNNLSSPSLLRSSAATAARRRHCCYALHSPISATSTSAPTKLQNPPTNSPPQVHGGNGGDERGEFYLNLGTAVRTLREDLPALFVQDLDYDIYRDDITFMDPMNTFQGIENYKLIFWALRFHGKILFRDISLQVIRIWQPSDDTILIRWNLKGVPRVPWEARGEFQGTSRYKLDRKGKIYEHKVDNLAFNFPRIAMKPSTVLDMVVAGAACPAPASPNLLFMDNGFFMDEMCSCSWIAFYRAVRETLNQEGITAGIRNNDQMWLSCT